MKTPLDTPLITIVVAVLNAKATISRCIESIVSQTLASVELIVIDGASTDGTVEQITAYGNTINHFESGPDIGIYDAWNKALPHISGEWVLFLGSDDYLESHDVLAQAAVALQHVGSDTRIAYGRVRRVSAQTGGDDCTIGEPWEQASTRLWHHSPIPHQGTFHRSSLFRDHGPFDPSFKIAGDYEMLLRELKTHSATFIPDPPIISVMQQGGISTGGFSGLQILTELRRAQERHGHSHGAAFWLSAQIKALTRMLIGAVLGRKHGYAFIKLWRRICGAKTY
ncbi:MAG: glycosyltransferase [Verrucomicrobia bacterium]|jgi:glycosyltransferase involved in cell wall biosynthesis|nr:glycosyltransferase [Verrucomicrobiota bacterium]